MEAFKEKKKKKRKEKVNTRKARRSNVVNERIWDDFLVQLRHAFVVFLIASEIAFHRYHFVNTIAPEDESVM